MSFPLSIVSASILSSLSFHSVKPIELQKYTIFLNYIRNTFQDVFSKWQYDYQIPQDTYIPKIVWVMWWTGVSTLPPIVEFCLERIQSFCSTNQYDLRFVSDDNISNYINIDAERKMYQEGKINIQTLADISRVKLLNKYGGFWLDSTLFLSDKANDFLNDIVRTRVFYSIHLSEYPKWRSVSEGRYSTFFFASFPQNPLFGFCEDLFCAVLDKNGRSPDYYFFDYVIRSAYNELPYVQKMIDNVPGSNPNLYFLMSRLNDKYDEKLFPIILKDTALFKLDWRKRKLRENEQDITVLTYWDHLQAKNCGIV